MNLFARTIGATVACLWAFSLPAEAQDAPGSSPAPVAPPVIRQAPAAPAQAQPAPPAQPDVPPPASQVSPTVVFPPVENIVPGSQGQTVFPMVESIVPGGSQFPVVPPVEDLVPGGPTVQPAQEGALADDTAGATFEDVIPQPGTSRLIAPGFTVPPIFRAPRVVQPGSVPGVPGLLRGGTGGLRGDPEPSLITEGDVFETAIPLPGTAAQSPGRLPIDEVDSAYEIHEDYNPDEPDALDVSETP